MANWLPRPWGFGALYHREKKITVVTMKKMKRSAWENSPYLDHASFTPTCSACEVKILADSVFSETST